MLLGWAVEFVRLLAVDSVSDGSVLWELIQIIEIITSLE